MQAKEYTCRKHLRKPIMTLGYCFAYITSAFLIFGAISNLTLKHSDRVEFNENYWIIGVLFLACIALVGVILFKTIFKKCKHIRILVDDEKLTYKSIGVEKTIRYRDINQVEFVKRVFGNRYIYIKSDKEEIKIKSNIENIAVFTKDFIEKLSDLNKNSCYDEKSMDDFYKNVSYKDDSFERLYELLRFVMPILGVDVVFSFIFSFMVDNQNMRAIILLILYLFPIITLVILESILGIKHKLEVRDEKYVIRMRDYQYEHRVYDAITIVLVIVILTVLIYLSIKY
ncbi:hypothetical protein KQI77_11860 [Clostridium sp. MSJ-8]|uniref:hypothetical protein n=1 Tax=Clostridium sp. MSJ-8 TaxID=2841510 RepID=UPI001C0F3712|nr:hypothetical protein [Clostridium sp. MSJ-8]MBU5488823.1 hypothetical protein [Clostridium sp. MSJ-8]